MNEDQLVLICIIIGLIAGAPLGYLLGRYRITVKRVEVEEGEHFLSTVNKDTVTIRRLERLREYESANDVKGSK